MGTLFPSLQLAAQALQSERNVGIAVVNFHFVRSFGQTFGVTMGGDIFQNKFDENRTIRFPRLHPDYVVSGRDAVAFVSVLSSVPDAVRIILQYVYADLLSVIWYVMVPFARIGFLLSLLAKDLFLSRKHDAVQPFDEKFAKDDVKVYVVAIYQNV